MLAKQLLSGVAIQRPLKLPDKSNYALHSFGFAAPKEFSCEACQSDQPLVEHEPQSDGARIAGYAL